MTSDRYDLAVTSRQSLLWGTIYQATAISVAPDRPSVHRREVNTVKDSEKRTRKKAT